MKTLTIGYGDCFSSTIEYFLYKLINIEKISIDIIADDTFSGEEEIIRIPKLIQIVPQRELFYTIIEEDNARGVLKYLKQVGCIIAVKEVDFGNDIRLKIL
ncbi:hypothetical protein PS15p_201582 [Mucor circinelloides]